MPHEIAGVEGYCNICREITPNRLLVVGHMMKARRCEVCGGIVRPKTPLLAECYMDDFFDRLGNLVKSAKPTRLRSYTGHLYEIPLDAGKLVLREAAYLDDLFVRRIPWPKRK